MITRLICMTIIRARIVIIVLGMIGALFGCSKKLG